MRRVLLAPRLRGPLFLSLCLSLSLSLCLPASLGLAANVEPARVRVAASLVDDVVRGLLPIDVVLPTPLGGTPDAGAPPTPSAVTLTELRYCGVTEKGGGRFRGVLRGGSLGGTASPLLVGDDGCRQSLSDLTRHAREREAGARDDLVGVADLEATWRPWEVRLAITRLTGPGAPKPGGPRPLAGGLDTRWELLSLPTAGCRVLIEAGETVGVHAAPVFVPEAIDLVAALSEGGSGPPAARPGVGGPGPGLLAGTNFAVDLPFGFANQMLRLLTASRPLAIPLDREVIDVAAVSVGGGTSGLAVAALATPRSVGETARLIVQASGDEVRVLAVRAEAQLENCAGLGALAALGCNARNAGRGAAATALGATLTQKYRGQLARELAGSQTLRVEVGGRRLAFRADIVHLTGTSRGVSVGVRLSPGGDH